MDIGPSSPVSPANCQAILPVREVIPSTSTCPDAPLMVATMRVVPAAASVSTLKGAFHGRRPVASSTAHSPVQFTVSHE